jgi:hypothetical protein
LKIEKDNENYVAVITNAGDNTLTLLNFGSSVMNSILPAQIVKTASFPGTGNHLLSTSLIKDCGKWYGITISYTNNNIFKTEFETIFSCPVVSNITSGFPVIALPLAVSLIKGR